MTTPRPSRDSANAPSSGNFRSRRELIGVDDGETLYWV